MTDTSSLTFKVASEEWEFEQIHELNYQTFVEEIPQHEENARGRLVDKFHQENTYVICLNGEDLLGMIALRDKRPLSLDAKLEDLDSYLPPFKSILEYRLLAVRKENRNTAIFAGIMKKAFYMALQGGYDIAVISGTTRQERLYRHLGFQPFGPLVGPGDALYQPMYIDLASALRLKQKSQVLHSSRGAEGEQVLFNYLPGPVAVANAVLEVNSGRPISHRNTSFVERVTAFRKMLSNKLNTDQVQIMAGSGTLANDVVAAHLALLSGKGLVLVNGEFGERLRDHALRAELDFIAVEAEWGQTFSREALEAALRDTPRLAWVWAVHCETSTGVLNNLEMLRRLCREHRLRLCLDAISSIGSCPVDLHEVYLATATSGKGIGSLPGLALVFSRDDLVSGEQRLSRYFDLSYYESKQGIPFTISSNAVEALITAVEKGNWLTHFEKVRQWSEELRDELEVLGLPVLADKQCRAPHVTTIALPPSLSSQTLGDHLAAEGILVSYRSEYLLARNYIQVCFMGECQRPTGMMSYFLRKAVENAGADPSVSMEED
ncbi:MAG: aminotransferase class V-fold PLP-dependent enzyme [Candidatus Electrothrix aestuarii]|uniref:Aminotransferase class V-fold PLP-dependent enzyme n=1 Tax=Candidatus Electrothrix aestuarii TaxID=3062594 RepID=A0AAU8LVH2_9BACT|nr:aminotransferase class V-fold PLP-dependent enzyme [Candidatus Electrothrix aestuarii]